MAKRTKFGAGDLDKLTAEKISSKAMEKDEKKEAKRFNLRIPHSLANRLETVSEATGLSRTAIILGGLNLELNRLEQTMKG